MRSSRRRRFGVESLLLAGAVLVVGYLTVVPVGYVVWRTFVDAGRPTLGFAKAAYSAYGLSDMLWNSLVFSLGAAIVAVTAGSILGYLVVRTDLPAKPVVVAGALVPLIVPGVLYTISWVFLAAPRTGALNKLVEAVAGGRAIDIFSLQGMILVEGIHLTPLAFLLMAAAFRSLDPSLEESALASGARGTTVLRRVSLPLVRPALAAATLIVVVRALEAFEVPALLGLPGGIWVFTSRIWRSLGEYPPAVGEAGAYALPLLALTAVGVVAYVLLTRRTTRYQTVTGRGFRPRPVPLGRWRWPVTGAVAAYLILTAVLPILVLVYVSTQRYYAPPSIQGLSDMSLRSYRELLSDDDFWRATRNSVVLGLGTATAVMLGMAVVGWLVVRSKIRGRSALDQLAFLPIAIPGVVLGLAVLVVYLQVPLPVYGTLWILFIAYFTRFMPYGLRTSSISMAQIATELEESAHVSGAGWWQTFRRVLFPLVLPGLLAGWIYILLMTLRELSASILLYSPGKEVLPILVWEQYASGQFPDLAALGVLMVAATLLLAWAAYKLGSRVGLRFH